MCSPFAAMTSPLRSSVLLDARGHPHGEQCARAGAVELALAPSCAVAALPEGARCGMQARQGHLRHVGDLLQGEERALNGRRQLVGIYQHAAENLRMLSVDLEEHEERGAIARREQCPECQ